VSDDSAVFVAPGGSGLGTMTEPASTITLALVIANARKKSRIIVCGGTYGEAVTLTAADGAVAIFGGFQCPNDPNPWAYDASRRAAVKPTATEPALRVTDATSGIVIEDIDFFATDAPPRTGASSIGALVARSTLTMRRSSIHAGTGADGTNGTNGEKGSDGYAATGAQNGKPSGVFALGGAWAFPSLCGSLGGRGASNALSSRSEKGLPDKGILVENYDNSVASSATGDGKPGGPGLDGNPGENGITSHAAGTFDASAYAAADGADGIDGYTAQGGGGGGASRDPSAVIYGASGGAGGIGGCGGKHGTGGKGGGASVALVAWDGEIHLEDVTLVSVKGGKGGDGGNGGAGGIGFPGGIGGARDSTKGIGKGGDGGTGGTGGAGGSGSGGSGGPSYALVFHGAAPTTGGTMRLSFGGGGLHGVGGSFLGTLADRASPGLDGLAGDRLEQP
jgi:hypothetical protein